MFHLNLALYITAVKWKPRRKLLVPTFSPKILESFIPVFVRESNILIDCLEKECGQGSFDAWEYVSKQALDAICGKNFNISDIVKYLFRIIFRYCHGG